MNDAMSLGIHRLWKDEFVRMMGPSPGISYLDLAGKQEEKIFFFPSLISVL
jgi:hypothetical protein